MRSNDKFIFYKIRNIPFETIFFIGKFSWQQKTNLNMFELDFIDLKSGAFENMSTYTAGPAAIAAYYDSRPKSTQLVTCLGGFSLPYIALGR